jgi:hypothetical protein
MDYLRPVFKKLYNAQKVRNGIWERVFFQREI